MVLMRGYKKLVKNAREYLKTVEDKMQNISNDSEEFYIIMKEFYDFLSEINSIRARNIEEFTLPEDVEVNLNKLNTEFKIKNFNGDENTWAEHIQDSIFRLLNLYNTMPDGMNSREKRIIQDSVERHYKHLLELVDYYQKQFGKDIPTPYRQEMVSCIKKFQTHHGLYIKTKEDMNLGSIDIKFVDFDQALDVYEKIKKAKGSKKEELEEQLKSMIKILKED